MKSKTLHPLLVPPLGRVCVCAHTRVHMFMHLVTQLCPTLATPWTVAPQAPLSMGFPRQEYWSSLPFSSPLYLPNSGIEPASLASPALAGGFFYFYFFYFFRRILLMLSHLGSPQHQTTKKKKKSQELRQGKTSTSDPFQQNSTLEGTCSVSLLYLFLLLLGWGFL